MGRTTPSCAQLPASRERKKIQIRPLSPRDPRPLAREHSEPGCGRHAMMPWETTRSCAPGLVSWLISRAKLVKRAKPLDTWCPNNSSSTPLGREACAALCPSFACYARWRAPPRRGHAGSAHRNRRAVERRRLSPSAGQSSAGCASTRESSVDPLLAERAFCCGPTGRWSRSALGRARTVMRRPWMRPWIWRTRKGRAACRCAEPDLLPTQLNC